LKIETANTETATLFSKFQFWINPMVFPYLPANKPPGITYDYGMFWVELGVSTKHKTNPRYKKEKRLVYFWEKPPPSPNGFHKVYVRLVVISWDWTKKLEESHVSDEMMEEFAKNRWTNTENTQTQQIMEFRWYLGKKILEFESRLKMLTSTFSFKILLQNFASNLTLYINVTSKWCEQQVAFWTSFMNL